MPIPTPPSAADLAALTRLHRAVRYLDAYQFWQQFAPLEDWVGTEALVLAGRFASSWGDWARSNRLHTQAWRRDPAHPSAIFFQAVTVEQKHGPFEALRFMHEQRKTLEIAAPTRD